MTNLEKLNEIESTFEAISKLNKEASEQTGNFIRKMPQIYDVGIKEIDEAYLKAIACNKAFFEFTKNNMKFFIEELKKLLEATNAPEILTRVIPDSLTGIFGCRDAQILELTPLDLFEKADAKVRMSHLSQMINHRISICNAINLAQCLFMPQLTEYYKTKEESEGNKKDD